MSNSLPSFFNTYNSFDFLRDPRNSGEIMKGPKADPDLTYKDIFAAPSPPSAPGSSEDSSEKEKSFLDKFIDRGFVQNEGLQEMIKEGNQSYRPSVGDQTDDFLAQLMGGGESGFSKVGPNLSVQRGNTSARDAAILQKNQQEMQRAAEARQTKSSVGRMAGSFLGNALFPGVGGVVGGILGGFLCDIRFKKDIAPLQKSEVNDILSECAFFVKDLNECS